MMPRFVTLLLLAVVAWPTSSAFCAYDPCQPLYNRMMCAQIRADQADRRVMQVENNLANQQNQVELRLASYQASVDTAWANVQAANTISNGYTTGCVVRTIFWGANGCVSNSIYTGSARRANATAAYNSAVARRNAYAVYSQGFIRRQAEQVVNAQNRYNTELANYQRAEADYQVCQANPPCQNPRLCH